MNILFYASFTNRSRDTESLMRAFSTQGHQVFFLNQHEKSIIRPYLEGNDIHVDEYTPNVRNRWLKHFLNIRYLIYYCWKYRIDVVYSHLEPANFISVFAQFFIRAKVYVCRHHSDLFALLKIDQDLSYRLTYKLARNILVVSKNAKKYMVENEQISENKINVINLAYDFSLYTKPDAENVISLQKSLNTKIVFLTIGNLNTFKRPLQSLGVLYELVQKGYDVKLIYLGNGELAEEIKKQSAAWGIEDKVIMEGYVSNVLDYLRVTTFLLHPSVSESSCVVVKEAGLTETPIIACRGVGDFDTYLVDGFNGFLVNPDLFVPEAINAIEKHMKHEDHLKKMGLNLKKSILANFSVAHILPQYEKLNTK